MVVVLVCTADSWRGGAPFRLFTQCWDGLEHSQAFKWLLKANISYHCWGETDPTYCQCKEKCRQRKVEKSYLGEKSLINVTLWEVYIFKLYEFGLVQSTMWNDSCIVDCSKNYSSNSLKKITHCNDFSSYCML